MTAKGTAASRQTSQDQSNEEKGTRTSETIGVRLGSASCCSRASFSPFAWFQEPSRRWLSRTCTHQSSSVNSSQRETSMHHPKACQCKIHSCVDALQPL